MSQPRLSPERFLSLGAEIVVPNGGGRISTRQIADILTAPHFALEAPLALRQIVALIGFGSAFRVPRDEDYRVERRGFFWWADNMRVACEPRDFDVLAVTDGVVSLDRDDRNRIGGQGPWEWGSYGSYRGHSNLHVLVRDVRRFAAGDEGQGDTVNSTALAEGVLLAETPAFAAAMGARYASLRPAVPVISEEGMATVVRCPA